MSAPESPLLDAKRPTKICARHGKKRQSTFLVLSEEGEWICRDEDQCKMSQVGSKHRFSKLEDGLEQHTTDKLESSGYWLNNPAPSERPRSFGDVSVPSVTSWADEVDQEFPEGLLALDDSRPTFRERNFRETAPLHRWTSYPQSYPAATRRNSFLPAKYKRTLGERNRSQYNEEDLLRRIDQLQDELNSTKRELRKAREEIKLVMKNEKMLEGVVQGLRVEVAEIRKKQLQLDLSGHDDRYRKPVSQMPGSAKLNPEATPFVPVTYCCAGHLPYTISASHKEDPMRTVDSARSYVTNDGSQATAQTVLSVLEVESYDSENFGVHHEDGSYWSEHDDDRRVALQSSRVTRSRSQETYNRGGLLSSMKAGY